MPHPEMHSEETGLRNNQNFITKGIRRIRQRVYVFRLGCHGRYSTVLLLHKVTQVLLYRVTRKWLYHKTFLSTCQCCQFTLSSEAVSH